jgi:hypothetical protein
MNVDDGIIVHVLVSYTCVSTGLNFTRLGKKLELKTVLRHPTKKDDSIHSMHSNGDTFYVL